MNKNINRAVKYYKKSINYSKISLLDYIIIFVNLLDTIIPIKYILRENIMRLSQNLKFRVLIKLMRF